MQPTSEQKWAPPGAPARAHDVVFRGSEVPHPPPAKSYGGYVPLMTTPPQANIPSTSHMSSFPACKGSYSFSFSCKFGVLSMVIALCRRTDRKNIVLHCSQRHYFAYIVDGFLKVKGNVLNVSLYLSKVGFIHFLYRFAILYASTVTF